MFDELNQLLDADDVAAKINQGMGVDPDAFQASEVTLVSMLVDDSGSIEYAGNTPNVIAGVNGILDALLGSKAAGTILVHTRLLNGRIVCPFVALQDAPKLGRTNYTADGCTPLYDAIVEFGGTVAKKTREFLDNGVVVRSISVVVTDGKDEGSKRNTVADARKVVDSLLASETAVFCGMGIQLPGTDFNAIFDSMGIRPDSVMLVNSDPKAIRAACHAFSQSAIRVSQTTGALGGLTV
jgi:hypothetical protein